MSDSDPIGGKIETKLECAVSFHKNGDLRAAVELYKQLLEHTPSHPDALHLLGLAFHQLGDSERAVEHIQTAISHSNNDLYYNNLARIYLHLKRYDLAETAGQKAVKLAPQNPSSLALLADAHLRLGKTTASEQLLRQALRIDRHHLEGLTTLGYLLLLEKRYDEAVSVLTTAMQIAPTHVPAAIHYGRTLLALNRTDDAIAALDNIQTHAPESSIVSSVLAEALQRNGQVEKALNVLERALEAEPHNAIILNDIGHVLRDLNRSNEAEQCFRKAIEISPQQADAHVNLGLTLLSEERFGDAWAHYAHRCNQPDVRAKKPQLGLPDWSGQHNLEQFDLTVWTEQGLGDEVLQLSLLPDLVKLTKNVTLICSDRLKSLCDRSFPTVEVIPRQMLDSHRKPLKGLACPLLDLGSLLRPDISMFPNSTGYLCANDTLTRELQRKYKSLAKHADNPMVIALSWQSRNALHGNRNSIPLQNWAPILRAPHLHNRDVVFITSQYDVDAEEVETAANKIGVEIHLDAEIDHSGDMESVSAQLAASDLIISTSTTTAQFAAALGRPVWHLPSTGLACGWYWTTHGGTTPWYSNMRQFRRADEHGKGPQVREVADALIKHLS